MDFKELQKGIMANIKKYEKKHNIKFDENTAVLKLGEEVGEFMQAVLVYKKQCRMKKRLTKEEARKEMAKELSDVAGMAIVNASAFSIDLEEAIYKKWISKEWSN